MSTQEAREALGFDHDQSFDSVSITVASADTIRGWSRGEVKNPETINYRTFKPEPGGLFCQRIFGPVRDYECACGKYKRIKFKGVICDRCGVEVTVARVRRERMGHIELAVPVSHIWFLKSMPSRLGLLLDMTARSLERVIYYENYMVVDPGKTPMEPKQLLTEQEYIQAQDEYGEDAFVAKMGAEALRDSLAQLELEPEIATLHEQMHSTRSKQIKKKLAKRLKVIQGFIDSNTRPEWMVLDVLPVIPPDLRPLVPLEGGRFATSDLNDLYRRVINRNNRLKNLLQLKTPDVIIHNEKRMLQEAVDALFDNGRHGRAVTGAGNRPLKSLSDMLKGKQGRFRQNLLGKRVDYSGRSVIVIGPELKLNECGLPKKMALVLFEPFIIRRLKELGFVHTVRGARKMIEKKSPEVWDILEEVTKGHPVMLNRAPTLHRLSIQAFEPKLIEGNAIRLHPLVCTAYNADFDGDQMAVHVPLSIEAVLEAKLLMLATHNIFSPSSGKPILTPSQDVVLGTYYLTADPKVKPVKGKLVPLIATRDEVILAEATRDDFNLHTWVDFVNPDYGKPGTIYGNHEKKIIRTTVGRILFAEIWPEKIGFVNFAVTKKKIGDLIMNSYKVAGKRDVVPVLDALKTLGFKMATRAGISVGIGDMIIPEDKKDIIAAARKRIEEVEGQYSKGIITTGERYNKIIDIWTGATDQIAASVFRELESNLGRPEINPVFLMMDSGARGNKQQVRQLCGTRGLMAKPSGDIIERPILSSFREGLSVLEYFLSTHGARKGLADTALKTADAGYLTRKLCDVAMDCVITEDDDGNRDGIWKHAIYEGDDEIVPLADRITGRCPSEDVRNPLEPDEIICKNGEIITELMAKKIDEVGIERVKVMTPLTHMRKNGIPALSYGLDPATGEMVKPGSAVGIVAAQSIGEPGTQLTMRTFHIGGIATGGMKNPEIKVRNSGRVRYSGLRLVQTADGASIVLNKTGTVQIMDEDDRVMEDYNIVTGAVLTVQDGGEIKKGTTLAMWDPFNIPILSEKAGMIGFREMIPGVTIKRELDSSTGRIATVVIEHKEDLNPQVEIRDNAGKVLATYAIPVGAQVAVSDGDTIAPGALLSKTPRSASKTQDITGGLPRVAELFEARRPKDATEMAKIDGVVSFGGAVRSKKKLIVTNEETGEQEEHLIPHGKHIIVHAGDVVHKGQHLTEGSADPHEILDILGPNTVQEYLLSEIQKVYRMQGVPINDKHIELIIARMLRKVRITDPGDSDYFWGEQIDKSDFLNENERIAEAGGKPAEGEPILLGITKASLETESFISAASFQETTRVLTDASTLGKRDRLSGFKENVIMGHLIPAGTGLPKYRRLKVNALGAPVENNPMVERDYSLSEDETSEGTFTPKVG
ncbi:DNA-directed RNA polymerase subunit beta' [Cerasicoccus arenae]|uniref:DNA-directed RNA polymerase subunit beta' n=1 Tax=Cerasicoccus arenae TaxID=424488 RepID=A0A8J3DCW0_9BACT|nr:DNA-directed RNA polymerase subunit beta' [Cerasicoccus arenae]MBK1859464.1 DNA-directed RNA polymerase subunit beta' [Cerasicoccus arenae]GHC11010.1 DNA-directed RNA polymerase subunit beta' [Cerasicoccus arenae]